MSFEDLIDRVRIEARMHVGCNEILFYSLYGLKSKTRRLGVTRETEVVIEGYPRCANSFAVLAFEMSQSREVEVGHHLHVPVQVERGIRRGLPTVVLIRNPRDATVSLVLRQPARTISQALREYLGFYNYILDLDESKYVVGDFNIVTKNFGVVISKINNKFGTDFENFKHTKENEEKIFDKLRSITPVSQEKDVRGSWPSRKKHKMKEEVRKKLESRRYKSLLRECECTYRSIVS